MSQSEKLRLKPQSKAYESTEIIARLKLCKRLPTLPAVALRLVELANDESATLDQFAEQITHDPALAGKLLRVANSSFYGRRRSVTNLSQAMSLLGLNATIALSLSFSLRACLAYQYSSGFDANTYWRRTLLTALACRSIAQVTEEIQPEDFLLAGLLQDIGILAMDAIFEDAYAALFQRSTDHEHLLIQESVRFGFTHAQVAAHLLKGWGLPERIYQSAWLSHELTRLPHDGPVDDDRLPFYVAAAAIVADAWMKEQETPDSIEAAHDAVNALLNIGLADYRRLITIMIDKIPEMETLFDAQLADPGMLRDLEYCARETLAVRSLQQAHQPDAASGVLASRVAILERQTQRDSLTGLYNRTHMNAVLEHEFERATFNNTPLSVAFIDVDRFKDINDTFGHAVGDQVLSMLAQRLQTQARQADTVVRYGGEEFVILLPETGTEPARAVLERMLAHVRDNPFRAQSGALGTITFSAGIATHMEAGRFFQDAASLLEAADLALYAAKRQGRQRVCVFHEDNYPDAGGDPDSRDGP